jgi:protein-tyrosine phosphatase
LDSIAGDPLPYRLPLEGAVNFRDLGGYRTQDGRRVARGRVYRSDSLHELTSADHQLFNSLGLRTICDLRVGGEKRLRPDHLPENHGLATHDLGFLPTGAKEMWAALNDGTISRAEVEAEMRHHYRLFVLEHSDRLRQLFELLVEAESLPLLFHCASGKDRTGFAAALVLAALGVDRETIVKDYMVSDRYRRDVAQMTADAMQSDAVRALQQAHPAYLASGFAAIEERWGSLQTYLADALGFNAPRVRELRHALLEPA